MERERELNQFKTQFINLASHQFRTPLATIRSSIDLLDLKLKSIHLDNAFQAFFAKHKAIIDEETTRMTELMENILDIGRIDEGKIELFKKNLPFIGLIQPVKLFHQRAFASPIFTQQRMNLTGAHVKIYPVIG